MKETSLYTGNTDAITTSLASVSENLCVQLSIPKKTITTECKISVTSTKLEKKITF